MGVNVSGGAAGVTASNAVPADTGTPAAGAGASVSRDDHVHNLEAHGIADHTDRTTTRWPIEFAHLAVDGGAASDASWQLIVATIAGFPCNVLSDSASADQDIVFAVIRAPTDLVTGTPTFDVILVSAGASGNIVIKLTARNTTDATTVDTAGTTTTTGAIAIAAADKTGELENISYPISVAAGDWQRISLTRAPLDANDTLAAAIRVAKGAALVYTADE